MGGDRYRAECARIAEACLWNCEVWDGELRARVADGEEIDWETFEADAADALDAWMTAGHVPLARHAAMATIRDEARRMIGCWMRTGRFRD